MEEMKYGEGKYLVCREEEKRRRKKRKYLEKEINGDTDQPIDRPTDRVNIVQSAFSKVRK